MSIKAATAFASVILAVPGIALAEFDYNFVEGSFVDVEIDDTSVYGDGIRLEASFSPSWRRPRCLPPSWRCASA
jgi:hypothetical protein